LYIIIDYKFFTQEGSIENFHIVKRGKEKGKKEEARKEVNMDLLGQLPP